MKESTLVADNPVSDAEAALADLETIESLGYPTQHLRLITSKIEIHLDALRRGTWQKSWHTTWLTRHCDHYWRLRDQMC